MKDSSDSSKPPKKKKGKKPRAPRNKPSSIPNLTDPLKHQCWLLYFAGFGMAEINEKTKVSEVRIRQWSHRGNWPKQRKDLEDLQNKKNPPLKQPMVQMVVNDNKGGIRKKFIEKAGKIAEADIDHWADVMTAIDRLENASGIAALNTVHRRNLGLEGEEGTQERGHITLNFLNNAEKPDFVRIIEPDKVKEIQDAE